MTTTLRSFFGANPTFPFDCAWPEDWAFPTEGRGLGTEVVVMVVAVVVVGG